MLLFKLLLAKQQQTWVCIIVLLLMLLLLLRDGAPFLVPCMCAGLYFGVGQGLGALIGGLLKERFGGQAMFFMCACVVLVAWLAGFVAELATAGRSSTGAGGGSASSQSDDSSQIMQQQDGLQLHPEAAGTPVLRRLWQLLSGSTKAVARDAAAVNGTRPWKHKYVQLHAKDSGPDLTGVLESLPVGAVEVQRL